MIEAYRPEHSGDRNQGYKALAFSEPRIPGELSVNISELSLDCLRRLVRKNQISFPSQVPVFSHVPKPNVQWRLVTLFFIHNWPCTSLGARYGLSIGYVREIISIWVQRAASLGYLEEISVIPIETGAEYHIDRRKRGKSRLDNASSPARPLRRLSLGKITIDLEARTVSAVGRDIQLTPNEWAILAKLVSQVDRPVSSPELIKLLVGAPMDKRGALRHFIESLRRKLEPDPTHPRYVTTEWATGYRLRVSETA